MTVPLNQLSRRHFLKTGAVGTAATLLAGPGAWARPLVGSRDSIVLRPYPHRVMPPLTFAYAADGMFDPFQAPVRVTSEGIEVSSAIDRPFSINARWYVEGFGFVWLSADNGGRQFTRDDFQGSRVRNLNVEFARSRVAQNAERMARYRTLGTTFSPEVTFLHDLSQELLEVAVRQSGEAAGERANRSLRHALWAGEKIELEHARSVLATPRTGPYYFGCETRQYVWARSEPFVERFVEAFNFATITHYVWDSWYEVFEPREGVYRWGIKDNIVDWLTEHDITIEGRPLLWFHPTVTPDWLAEKNFSEVMAYAENHTRNLVGHYGDKVLHWEVVNEYHDWANVHDFTPEQITDVVRLACETTHEVDPRVTRLINNCCPYGIYASYGHQAHGPADRPLRSPRQFVEDLIRDEVPFEITGLQMYFPQRCLADIVRHVERFTAFGKPVYITEIGASSGPTSEHVLSGQMEIRGAPYDWHRPWDEHLQADWLEQMYTVLYAMPGVEAVNWYDFSDFRPFILNGGLIREDSSPKPSYDRLIESLGEWGRLPER